MKKQLTVITCLLAFAFSSFATGKYSFDIMSSGKGKHTIIFIPGFSCSGRVWNETVKQLDANYKCIVLTMPGFGGVKPVDNPSIKNWVSEIANYIVDEKIDKPVIIGHSLGGLMAELLAAEHSNLISKIVIVDALPCLSALSNPTFKANESPDCNMMVSRFTGMDDDRFYAMQKQSVPSMVADSTVQDTVVHWSVVSDRKTMALIFCQFTNTDLREKIAGINCPSLILLEAGFKDYAKEMDGQYKKLVGAKLEYATKGLHFIMYDDRAWFYGQLKSFLP